MARWPLSNRRRKPSAEEDFVKRVLEHPPEPLKDLDAEYEIALGRLLERRIDPASEQDQRLVRRIARQFLFSYYTGYALLKFRPPYETNAGSARQRAVEASLQKLARIRPARALMAEHFMAALELRLHRLLQDNLDANKLTINPSEALQRRAVRLGFANDWEQLGYHLGFHDGGGGLFQSVSFGLGGFYLVFKGTGMAEQLEFENLMRFATRLASEQLWYRLTEVVGVIVTASLTNDQIAALLDFIRSLLDRALYPYQERRDGKSSAEIVEEMRLSRGLTRVLGWLGQQYERRTQNSYRYTQQYIREIHPHPEEEVWNARCQEVTAMLAMLAAQSEDARLLLSSQELHAEAIEVLLPHALRHRPLMELLARHMGISRWSLIGDGALERTRDSDQALDLEPLALLLGWVGARPDCFPWVAQILENTPRLTERAETWLTLRLREESNPDILSAVLQLGCRLVGHGSRRFRRLESALFQRLQSVLFSVEFPMRTEWLQSLMEGGQERVRQLLEQAAICLQQEPDSELGCRSRNILAAISDSIDRMHEPPPVLMACAWLVNPVDRIGDGRPLSERIHEALRWLGASENDQSVSQKVGSVLERVIRTYPQAHRVVARALGKMAATQVALPLLEFIMTQAADSDHRVGDPGVYAEAVKSVAALKPLTPKAIELIEAALHASRKWELRFAREITPAFVEKEVLPRLTQGVSSEAIPVLVGQVWRSHCGPVIDGRSMCVEPGSQIPVFVLDPPSLTSWLNEKVHRYLHMFEKEDLSPDGMLLHCVLQALATVTDLTLSQQRVIERVYRTSWNSLTMSLCLLVLGRQRPVREVTARELTRVLRRNPTVAFWRNSARYALRWLLFHLLWHMSPPDPDLNDASLCQGIAVNLIGVLLMHQMDDPVVRKYQHHLEKALIANTSIFRYGMEPHMANYASLGGSTSGSSGMARILGASQQEAEQELTAWVARPADRAYQVLVDLISMNALPSLRKMQ